jgi:hypothetical protein
MVELEVVETLGVTEKVFGGLPITFLNTVDSSSISNAQNHVV